MRVARSPFARIVAWWRSHTVQGIALAFVIAPSIGAWQVPLFSKAANASIVRVGGLYCLSMVPLLVALAFFASRAKATVRRCGVAALVAGAVYPMPMVLPVHFSLIQPGSVAGWSVFLAYCVALGAAIGWLVFAGARPARDGEE